MPQSNLATLVNALDPICRDALEQSAATAVRRQSHEITIEDFFLQLSDKTLVHHIFQQFDISLENFRKSLERLKGNAATTSRPVFSTLLVELLQEAFLLNSLEFQRPDINAFIIFLSILKKPIKYSIMPFYKVLGTIKADELASIMEGLDEENNLTVPAGQDRASKEGAGYLQDYTTDFTEEARKGNIDPVFARGPHIRQMIDILSRRRKNNPILVGDPGVGKTAVVEGLALKIVEGNIPDILKNTRILGLDMGRLQAGASVKGEFEKRLKGVIDEIKSSPIPTILFIDEAHTLVGSGNEAGSGDGANLLKPALARGELRTVAATTWSEYKKYFEKDAALARRFQLVKLDQPTTEETITIVRGIVPHYEKEHNVYVRDDAVLSIAELSTRYISGRQQPDKAIDLLDTACAKVKVSLRAKPSHLEELEEQKASLLREIAALERDACQGIIIPGQKTMAERHAKLNAMLATLDEEIASLAERWKKEQHLAQRIISQHIAERQDANGNQQSPQSVEDSTPVVGAAIGDAATHANSTENCRESNRPADGCDASNSNGPIAGDVNSDDANSSDAHGHSNTDNETCGDLAKKDGKSAPSAEDLRRQLTILQAGDPLVYYEVDPPLVASIVAEWTGIPTGKINEDDAEKLSALKENLAKRIKGQEHALNALEKAVFSARTGLNNPNAPIAIFLLVGPSGVGKTETALAVANELYGGDEMLISINMSEFQEKHTISRLIGSPPGYVGYGEGGRLTEAVRRQPYSVVLFDEVEKAHPDVVNLFYQIFDKGVLADGEGREIDFKNTMIFVTSNLGADIIAALCDEDDTYLASDADAVGDIINSTDIHDNANARSARNNGSTSDNDDACHNDTPKASVDPELLLSAIRPALSQFFHPALLGRMTIVPYTTISPTIMAQLVDLKLSHIAQRLKKHHHITLEWAKNVTRSIASSCTLTDTGARNIDHVINATLLPGISRHILSTLHKTSLSKLVIGLDAETGNFTYSGNEDAN